MTASNGFGELRADLRLLRGRKRVNDAVDRFGRARGVERAEDQVARLRSRQRELDRFQIAHFTHEDDVRIFAQRGLERIGEGEGVHAQFALVDETFFRLVNELDRVFDRDDVAFKGIVEIVDHGGQGRRFAGTGRAGHENQVPFLYRRAVARSGACRAFPAEGFP